ncbi:MAG TPA: MarR family transcriptional regulator [Actinophytocola sp.]|nr:MarR family transcriptional regulator [Actinophytocola sp.]
MSRNDETDPALTRRLGYLLKHAQLRMFELSTKALAPFGINGRELAVLVVLAGHEPASQLQAAQRLDVDRTTMVGLLDTLEDKGLVSRHPDAEDRRRNVVELTEPGRDTLRRATAANEAAEQEFLAPLSARAAGQLVDALRTVVRRPAD